MLKNILIFSIGMIVGGAVTYKYAMKKADDLVREELESIREYKNRHQNINVNVYGGDGGGEKEKDLDECQDIIRANGYSGADSDEKHIFGFDRAEREHPEDDKPEDENIYVISYEDFSDTHKEYEKVSLTYYEEDDTLIDERDELVPCPAGLVGDALERFGDMSDDENVVYVRNDNFALDFEITKVENGYFERVDADGKD